MLVSQVSSTKESACQCRKQSLNPWLEKSPWRRKRQLPPVFLPGKSHGQRSLVGYSPRGCRVKQQSTHTHTLNVQMKIALIKIQMYLNTTAVNHPVMFTRPLNEVKTFYIYSWSLVAKPLLSSSSQSFSHLNDQPPHHPRRANAKILTSL